MEVRQLQIFRILAEELNFTRTAERVHTVQSNVTAQIKALEEELGVPLFDRLGSKGHPDGCRAPVFTLRGAGADRHGTGTARGQDRFGAERASAHQRARERGHVSSVAVAAEFRRRFPHVELIFRPHLDDALAVELETGKVDMVIDMRDTISNPAFRSIPLRVERIFLLAHPNHALARQRTVKPADLAGQTLLLTENGCGYRAKLDRLLAMQNIRPGHVTEFSSVEAIKQCVAAGMGLALLPAIAVAREVRQYQFKALHWAGPSLDIQTHIAVAQRQMDLAGDGGVPGPGEKFVRRGGRG